MSKNNESQAVDGGRVIGRSDLIEQACNSMRPIIADKNFHLNDKMEMIESVFARTIEEEMRRVKKIAIDRINRCEEMTHSDARILVNGM